jgi:cell wall assembly regulator SMI1
VSRVAVGYLRLSGPASGELIRRLEQRTGLPLPAAYRDFLRQHDGGRLESNRDAADVIFSLGPVAVEEAGMWRNLEVYAGRLPNWLLPVASDEYGNLFAISLRDRDNGSVWFWDHEREADEDEAPTEANLTSRAPDWKSFLDSLEPPDLDNDALAEPFE